MTRLESLGGYCAEIRKRAEIRAGELLLEMEKNEGGGTGANQHRAACSGKEPAANGATKLSDLGITKKQSASWQKPRRAAESTLSVEIEMV